MNKFFILLLVMLNISGCSKFLKNHKPDEEPNLKALNEKKVAEIRTLVENFSIPESPKSIQTPDAKFICPAPQGKLDLKSVPKIDLVFVESDIREALLELSMVTQVPIVVDESVEALVSAGFQNKDFESALKIILSSGGYSYKVMQDYIFVGTSIPETDNASFHLLSQTCIYKPDYLTPIEIIDMLSPFYRPFVSSSKNRDYISVAAPSSMQSKIQSDILTLDQPHGQILLELSII